MGKRRIDWFGFISYTLLLLPLLCLSCSDNLNDNADIPVQEDNKMLVRAINQNCKYVLTEWWNSPKVISFQSSNPLYYEPLTEEQQEEVNKSIESFANWNNEEYLLIPNWQKNIHSENAILPSCYASRILSSAIHYGIYDERITGVSREEALRKVVLLISSLAKYHCSNSENGWGNCWQGALWAEILGMSALLIKRDLSSDCWNMVCNMIKSESNYVMNEAGVTIYKDREANVCPGRSGDSQAETDAWNATIFALAMVVIPNDVNMNVWRKCFIELNLTAMACPSDVYKDKIVDGYSLTDLTGSNINEDGTVTNHGRLHIDYMASPIESFAESAIALSFANDGRSYESLKFNVDKVFTALVDLDLGEFEPTKAGHHFYERTENGEATSDTNMPEDNDWGNNVRQANYYLVDIYASLIGADKSLPDKLKADKWAYCRLVKIHQMMKRDNSGRIYQDGEENFASGQLYAMACLTQVYSLQIGDIN